MRGVTVVSNRLPVRVRREASSWAVDPSDGGLVGAMEPVLRARGGAWIGWSGMSGAPSADSAALLRRHGDEAGFAVEDVPLSSAEHEAFYQGACNSVLWPLLHGLPDRARHRPADAAVYDRVNRRFAHAVAFSAPGERIWVHDYHLLQMGERLRRLRPGARLGFFLHTPFPRPDVMLDLPWGKGLVPSFQAFDVLGFQTEEDRANYHAWREAVAPAGAAGSGAPGQRTGAFPISIDWAAFHDQARAPAVVRRAQAIRRANLGRALLLGVDRLDYSKGIPHRLRAYARLLELRPELQGRVVLTQLAIPTRGGIEAYDETRREVEGLVAWIHARFARPDWSPVEYHHGTWERDELLARYVAADVGVVTPLRDGMNLVAKEFCAASHGRGVLVLSPFAGAAAELGRGALLADPFDVDELARVLHRAITMPGPERRGRLAGMQAQVRSADVHAWATSFLDALEGTPRPTRRGGRWRPTLARFPAQAP